MVKWICIFGLFVNPVIWGMSNLSCLVIGSSFSPESPLFGLALLQDVAGFFVGLGSLILLFLGALQLKRERALGITLTLTGLWIDVAWGVFAIVYFIVLAIVANVNPQANHWATDDKSSGQLGVIILPIILACGVWEVVALVWLHRNSRSLALTCVA
jgi:hypothetical protein